MSDNNTVEHGRSRIPNTPRSIWVKESISWALQNSKQKVFSILESTGEALLPYYHKVLDWLDSMWISPNRLVTIRTGVSLAALTILTQKPDISLSEAIWFMSALGIWLIADRVDGDLARYTNQCSPQGEVLDAGADKVIVFIGLALIISTLGISLEQQVLLWSLFWVNLTLDTVSQVSRWVNENIEAFQASWSQPLTNVERKTREYAKTSNGANILWKLKTGAAMSALVIWADSIVDLHDETKAISMITLLGVSTTLSLWSLGKKYLRSRSSSEE